MELMKKDGKYYKKHIGAGRHQELTDQKLITLLMTAGFSIEDAMNRMVKAKEQAIDYSEINSKNSEEAYDISTLKIDVIKKHNIFKNFLIVKNEVSQSSVVYYRNDTNTTSVCSAAAFDSRFAKNILEEFELDVLNDFHSELSRLIDPKDWTRVSIFQSLDVCLNIGRDIKTISTTFDPHPACVQGIDKFSLTIIPYSQKDITFVALNPYLQDFLRRTEHHTYLCAILWSHFIGNLLPYVIYLRGDGGDGKTSFINMLGKLARSYANFDGGDRFNYFNMFGKSIIGLNENESSKLMQNRVVKSISGGNSVQIEGKGKNSYSGQVRGLIIIDSNYDLELLGRQDEKRRLRYFRITVIDKTLNPITISQDTFIELLGQTPNEFLNYCRVCYEKLNIPGSGGLIQDTPNHDQIFTELTDSLQEHKFAEFYKHNIEKTHILEGKCESVNILLALEKKFPKDPYVQRNFKKYLETHYKIKPSGKYFIGLSKFDKELQEAMPKENT